MGDMNDLSTNGSFNWLRDIGDPAGNIGWENITDVFKYENVSCQVCDVLLEQRQCGTNQNSFNNAYSCLVVRATFLPLCNAAFKNITRMFNSLANSQVNVSHIVFHFFVNMCANGLQNRNHRECVKLSGKVMNGGELPYLKTTITVLNRATPLCSGKCLLPEELPTFDSVELDRLTREFPLMEGECGICNQMCMSVQNYSHHQEFLDTVKAEENLAGKALSVVKGALMKTKISSGLLQWTKKDEREECLLRHFYRDPLCALNMLRMHPQLSFLRGTQDTELFKEASSLTFGTCSACILCAILHVSVLNKCADKDRLRWLKHIEPILRAHGLSEVIFTC